MKSLMLSFIIALSALYWGCSGSAGPSVDGEKVRSYANALYNRELYTQAVAEYQRYLDQYKTDAGQQANINYVIGNIYFERLHDYENAMAYFLKVKHLYPESGLADQVNRRIVTCLERLQRSTDAKQALDEATSLDPSAIPESRPGEVVARIGDREITSGDLDFHIGQLPDYIQSQMTTREQKLQFLTQFVATELFYGAAKRMELDKEKEVIEGAFQAKKNLMVQAYLKNQIASQMDVKPEDVELYYKAHQDKYVEKDDDGQVTRQKSFQEAGQEAAQDLMREKQQKAYDELLQRMMRTEKVQIFDDKVK